MIDQNKRMVLNPWILVLETNRLMNGRNSTQTYEAIEVRIRLYDTWNKGERAPNGRQC